MFTRCSLDVHKMFTRGSRSFHEQFTYDFPNHQHRSPFFSRTAPKKCSRPLRSWRCPRRPRRWDLEIQWGDLIDIELFGNCCCCCCFFWTYIWLKNLMNDFRIGIEDWLVAMSGGLELARPGWFTWRVTRQTRLITIWFSWNDGRLPDLWKIHGGVVHHCESLRSRCWTAFYCVLLP